VQIVDQLARVEVHGESLLTVGAFDGVHRGHQYLIRNLVRRARQTGCLAALLTFYPHPRTVLLPGRPFQYLTSPGEKAALFERLGLDLAAIIPFTLELANMPAQDFIAEVHERFQMRELWVGRDFALGRNREGDVEMLRQLGRAMGFEVHAVDPIKWQGEVVSSTRIRQLLSEGRVRDAARLLGRLYSVSGRVVGGSRRGKRIGLPTANIEVLPERLIPAQGVYATFTWVGEDRYKSVTNIGTCPTFGGEKLRLESYLLDFQGDLYGYDLVVEFVARLRDEKRFPDATALLHQVTQDILIARRRGALPPHPPHHAGRRPVDHRDGGNPTVPRAGGGDTVKAEGRAEDDTPNGSFVEILHTADRAIQVRAASLLALFAAAARGMFSLMTDLERVRPCLSRTVQMEGLDLEVLLVEWLNELLFLHETHGELYCRFEVLDLQSDSLKARAWGEPGLPTKAEIKAATYHNLEIREEGGLWLATIVFDV